MKTSLGVNIDHVATLRQARRGTSPDPVAAAAIAELAGARQITIHLREDRRHIQERDLRLIRQTVQTELNLEMAANAEIVQIAFDVRPDTSTLVPERREELTTEGGLDVVGQQDALKKVVRELTEAEIRVSLFIAPDIDQIRASHRIGAPRIELHTGRYADAETKSEREAELNRIVDAAKLARKLGMSVAAGHGLDYVNVQAVARIDEIDELNIGHSIVSRAVFVGLDRAIRDMRDLIERA
ncbi:MAG: pyridoxine 5'-phosphate synthase [Myxococcales bacterium]|jgi:pyridoxine 5-phosphate synthase|nr:pyridoxine 5'-phosphate synthase [Myxococcales bacterium]